MMIDILIMIEMIIIIINIIDHPNLIELTDPRQAIQIIITISRILNIQRKIIINHDIDQDHQVIIDLKENIRCIMIKNEIIINLNIHINNSNNKKDIIKILTRIIKMKNFGKKEDWNVLMHLIIH